MAAMNGLPIGSGTRLGWRWFCGFCGLFLSSAVMAQQPLQELPWTSLFDGTTLHGWSSAKFGGDGAISVEKGAIELNFGHPLTGVTYQGDKPLPTLNYQIQLQARRLAGSDF